MMKPVRFNKLVCGLAFAFLINVPVNAQPVSFGTKTIQQDLHIVVKSGDTVTSIVKKVMGSIEIWPKVAEYNKLTSPDSLSPGDIIIIPWQLVELRNFARVVFFKGNVTVTRRGSSEAVRLEKGDKIYIGDVVRTGVDGFVSLTFRGDTLVNIQPASQLLLTEMDCFETDKSCAIEVNSAAGELQMKVRNVGFSEPTKFIVDTAYASAAVRGTDFDMATGSDGNALGVTEGQVAISANNESNDVATGKGVLAGEGRSVSVLFDLLKKPQFNKVLRVSSEDFISWKGVEKALSYKVVLAASESMTDIIQSSTVQQRIIPALPRAGRYFVSARGIDENGLQGFDSIQPIDQVGIDDNTNAPPLEITLTGETLTIVPGGQVTSEIHLGQSLEVVDGLDTLLDYESFDVEPGKPMTITVDSTKDVYLTSRAVINATTVSAYGSLYELKKSGN